MKFVVYEERKQEGMPVSRALQIIGGNISQRLSDRRIGHAFSALGFTFRRTNSTRGYIVVQRSPLEIKERQKQLAVTK